MRLPGYASLAHRTLCASLDLGRHGFDEGTLARRAAVAVANRLRRQVKDPVLREALTPRYPLGCKRVIYSNDYYAALQLPQAELVTAGIECITATGVRTADGRDHGLDALVCATGYDTTHPLSGLPVRGKGGRLLSEAWAGGPQAYLGISVPDFPNFFLMLGPNTLTGHNSALLSLEPQVAHAIACMQRLRSEGSRWIAVKAGAAQMQDAALQRQLSTSVWAQCNSWYRSESGRIVAIWPGFARDYAWAVRRPDPAAYELG
jgi:cation diffusion facilitator CzcD-associated flavoprotein CzcO